MKKAKLLLNVFIFLIMIFSAFNVQSQTAINLGTINITGKNPGDTLMIPLRMTGTNLSTGAIYFDYDQSVLAPQASMFFQVNTPPTNTPGIIGGISNPYFLIGNPGIYYWEFFSNTLFDPIPDMDNTLIGYFCFIYTGGTTGTTTIHLRSTTSPVCYMYDFDLAPVTINSFSPDFTVTGSTTPSTIILYSRPPATGTSNWDNPATWSLTPGGAVGTVLTPTSIFDVVIQGREVTKTGVVPGPSKCKNLTINPAGKLTVNDAAYTLNVGGNILIEGDAASTGSFFNKGTLTVAGTTSVQRWVTANWAGGPQTATTIWHYVSSPVASATINTFLGSILNQWNEPMNRWDPLTLPVTIPLVPGIGYGLAKLAPDGLVTFSGGNLNNNATYVQPVSLTGTAGANTGWNMLGNPYPCAIDWDLITARTNVAGAVYTWNGTINNYISWNGTAGSLTNGVIPAEQAFFVQATATGASITIPGTARLHSATMLYKNTVENLLTLKVKGNDVYEDAAFINFRPEATNGFDIDYDAYKLFGMEIAPQLYSMTSTDILTINTLPDVSSNPVVPMGFKVGISGTYTMTASDLESFPAGSVCFLEDIKAGKIQDMKTNPVYTFIASTGDDAHRFNVHFAPVGVSENAKSSGIKVYSAESTVYVNVPSDMTGNIIIYNMLGVEITRTVIQSHSLNKINLNVPTGFYLVKVDGTTSSTTGKVFIR